MRNAGVSPRFGYPALGLLRHLAIQEKVSLPWVFARYYRSGTLAKSPNESALLWKNHDMLDKHVLPPDRHDQYPGHMSTTMSLTNLMHCSVTLEFANATLNALKGFLQPEDDSLESIFLSTCGPSHVGCCLLMTIDLGFAKPLTSIVRPSSPTFSKL